MGLTHRHERKRKQHELSNIIEEFKVQQTKTIELVESLHSERLLATKTIKDVEDFVNSLKNTPDKFKNEMKTIMLNIQIFEEKIAIVDKHLKSFTSEAKKTAGAGVLAGVGIGALGPSAAMAVATTFGTASTGIAIASLSGAAATNASLAWLGGGTLSTGGGGIAAGKAFLSLAGPVGWSIAGLGIIGSVLISAKGNREYIREADTKISEITIGILELRKSFALVNELKEKTSRLRESIEKLLKTIKMQDMDKMLMRIKEFNEMFLCDRNLLAAFAKLINLTNALSTLIIKDVEKSDEQ